MSGAPIIRGATITQAGIVTVRARAADIAGDAADAGTAGAVIAGTSRAVAAGEEVAIAVTVEIGASSASQVRRRSSFRTERRKGGLIPRAKRASSGARRTATWRRLATRTSGRTLSGSTAFAAETRSLPRRAWIIAVVPRWPRSHS